MSYSTINHTQYSKACIMWFSKFSLTLHLLILQTSCFINASFLYWVFCHELGMCKREENYVLHFSTAVCCRYLLKVSRVHTYSCVTSAAGISIKTFQPGRIFRNSTSRVSTEFRPWYFILEKRRINLVWVSNLSVLREVSCSHCFQCPSHESCAAQHFFLCLLSSI